MAQGRANVEQDQQRAQDLLEQHAQVSAAIERHVESTDPDFVLKFRKLIDDSHVTSTHMDKVILKCYYNDACEAASQLAGAQQANPSNLQIGTQTHTNTNGAMEGPFQNLILKPTVRHIQTIDNIPETKPTIQNTLNSYIDNLTQEEEKSIEEKVRATYPVTLQNLILDGIMDVDEKNIKGRRRLFQEEIGLQKMYEEDQTNPQISLLLKKTQRDALNAELAGSLNFIRNRKLQKKIAKLEKDIEEEEEFDEL